MLFRTPIVSTRTLLQLTVAITFFVAGVGAAFAANTGIAPLLVPYTVNVIAGTPQFITPAVASPAGYFGEGVTATTNPTHPSANPPSAGVMNAPYDMAVDSVGNVYITDTGNDIIREVNAQTGNITTIAGVIPKGCAGIACTQRVSGCADGVPAVGAAIGNAIQGIAVDAYGNVYFDDATTATVSVIYRGGAQVANFIALENPTGVAASSGVQVGYIYHVAGTINGLNTTSCTGTTGPIDNALAFQSAQLKSPELISLDSVGNIYIADTGNATVRVINTQATPQTFFQYTIQPGYIRSITNCNPAMTVSCPTATVTATANTGINGPANALVFNSQYKNATADAFGNIYQLNGKSGSIGPPGYYGAAAYAGGAPLTNLLTAEQPIIGPIYPSPSMLPLTYGNSYDVLNNMTLSSTLPGSIQDVQVMNVATLSIRPSSLRPDIFGTFWFLDTHYTELNRIDQYTSLATIIIKGGTTSNSRHTAPPVAGNNAPASFTNPSPYYCVFGTAALPWTQGPQTFDPWGDGCPAIVAAEGGNTASGPDALTDGLGNLYISDSTNQIMRELPLGNAFPLTAVRTSKPVTQAIQVHFNSSNPPIVGSSVADGAMAGVTTSSFSIAPGISDFTINTTTPEFPLGSLMTNSTGGPNAYDKTTGSDSGNFQMWAGLPTCTQLGTYPLGTLITDYDCLIYVTFNPTAPGVRQSQLVVTTGPSKVSPTGNVYYFSLSGVGSGGQLVIDGGASTPVAATGLGTTSSVAVTQSGTVYIADSDNNRIVVEPAGGAAQTAIGPVMTLPASVTPASLSGPKGVAVDSTGNVYISDTGNNRILKVDASSGATSVLGNYVWIPGNPATAPPQYAFKAPQGLAVDSWNNVYVADTGNSVVVEIPSNYQLGGAVPLLAYPGAPKFSNPVAIAVDPQGNIYVADTKIAGGVIVMLPPGGGDLVNVPGTQFKIPINQTGLGAPNGVAVDAAGNIYASDGSKNKVVVIPSGPGSNPYTVNFSTLNAPAGLALDASGNLYVADSGDKQVLFSNRQTPLVDFGNVPQNQANPVQPLCAGTIMSDGFNTGNNSPCVLTVTNIGDQSVTLTAPVTAVVGAGNAAYSLSDNCATVVAGGPLPSGIACTIKPTFNPTVDNAQTESVTINGGPQALSLTANGEQPQANIVLSAAYTGGSVAAAGATATITATVTQPHIPGNTPSGTVTFIYTIDAKNQNVNNCGAGGTQTATLNASGIASFNLPTLVQGVQYTISANYNGDLLNSATQAVPYLVSVPGIPVTATVTSTPAQLTFIYGGAPPVVSGTLTPIPPSPITFKFGSAALATTPAKTTYGVTVTFSGAGACAYGFPASNYANGSPALVTENPAPLSYVLPNFTAQYGAPDLGYGANAVITGAVNGDTFIPSFTPPQSSILAVGPYTVVATLTGGSSDNYIVTAPPATLIVTQAPTALSITAAKTQVLNTTSGVASATFGISVGTLVIAGKGTPSGTVTLTDVFTPINTTGLGTAQAPITTVLPLVGAFVQYTPTNTAIGLHQYSFAYSGDADFQSTSIAPSSTAIPCAASAPSANCLVVDNPDFTLTSATGPVIIVPGVVPSQNGLLALPNQNASFPESAVLFVNAVLGFTGQVTLDCKTQNPSYVSCFVAPQTVCFATTSSSVCTNTALTAATVLAVQTPATLPLGFKFGSAQLRTSATRTVLAFLPFGVLAFCLRRRRRLSRALWMLMVVSAVGAGMSGCGGNQVAFYTPVPTGPQIVTVTATYVGNGASQPAGTRQFVVPIAID